MNLTTFYDTNFNFPIINDIQWTEIINQTGLNYDRIMNLQGDKDGGNERSKVLDDLLNYTLEIRRSNNSEKYGENMALGGPPSYATLNWLVQYWINEKDKYVPGTPDDSTQGHYTQMVDKRSTEVGCGFTSIPGGPMAQYGGTNVLVCQYTPMSDWNGIPPY